MTTMTTSNRKNIIALQVQHTTKVIIPKSKLYMSVSSDDDASSLIAEEHPIPSFHTLPTWKKIIFAQP